MNEEFKSEVLDKLDMITKALTRLAEAQTLRSMTEFCKLSPEQREDYYAGLEDIRKHGWNSLFEENRIDIEKVRDKYWGNNYVDFDNEMNKLMYGSVSEPFYGTENDE